MNFRLMLAFIGLAVATVPTAASAQLAGSGPQLVAADLRPGIDLSGLWHYSVDPYQSGLANFHGGPPNRSETRWAEVDVMDTMRRDTRALFEFDMASAPVTTLPASWLTHAPEMRYYQGLVWYQRHFSARRASAAFYASVQPTTSLAFISTARRSASTKAVSRRSRSM